MNMRNDRIVVHLTKRQLVAAMFEMAMMEPFNKTPVVLDDGLHTMAELANQMALTFAKGLPNGWTDDMEISQWHEFASQAPKDKGNAKG